jgi:CRISP-associated protein Cas1
VTDETPDLWQRITSNDALQQAWHRVAANEGSAGGDGISLRDFSANLFSNLTELRAELLQGVYRSSPFRKVSIPKKKPGYRILTIPAVRDRVVHASIAAALTPLFEPLFSESSFAYRLNRGVVQAATRIEQWRDKGYSIVIEADVISYFDNVDHTLLLEKVKHALGSIAGAASVLALLEILLLDQGKALNSPGKGIVQGSPLSPLLANLYLDALDDEIEDDGVKIVRFADDFVILCKSYKKAEAALQHCIKILDVHGLKLHDQGTRIVNFEKGSTL